MTYRIELWQHGKRILDAAWVGSFSEAKVEAEKSVKAGEADRVDIYDEGGDLRFRYPRVTTKAPWKTTIRAERQNHFQ